MAAAFEKALVWAIENSPPPLVVLIVSCFFLLLILWLSYRINKLINAALSQEARQSADIAELKKQQRKHEQLAERQPCVSKGNATWLQDKARNGGQAPEDCICQYLRDKK